MKLRELIYKENPFFVAMFGVIWQVLFFYIPLLFIVFLSLLKYTESGLFDGIWLGNFLSFFSLNYLYIIAKSLLLAFTTSILCFVLGYPIAHFIVFKVKKYKFFLLFLLILPFFTNFLLHVYAWFYVLEKTGFLNNFLLYFHFISKPIELLNSLSSIVGVMVYCYLPFMVLPLYSTLERINKNIMEASADLGANALQTWVRLILPLASSGIKSGFLLVFVPAYGEFAIPGLVGGEKYVFVGTAITKFVLGTKTMYLGAAFTILSCACVIAFIYFMNKMVDKIANYYGYQI